MGIHFQSLKSEKDGPAGLVLGCLLIGLLGLAAGLGFNSLRSSPLPLIPPFLLASPYPEAGPDQAQEWAEEGRVLFLDSRLHAQYKKAHLPQAVSLPVKDFHALYPVLSPLFPAEGWIVIYGEGGGRPTERELAHLFRKAGMERVKVLAGGFRAWKERGLRVEGR